MKILIVEPYFTGSHKAWAEGFAENSRYDIKILSLSGNFWKWRMHGGAVTLAKNFLADAYQPDLLLATGMLDLTTFLSLTRQRTSRVPAAVYFHENQLTYPWSPTDRDVQQKRDRHYGFINYTTALAADTVLFNSEYHRQSFLSELPRFLGHFPDHRGLDNIDQIERKSRVLPLGLDLSRFDGYRDGMRKSVKRKADGVGREGEREEQKAIASGNKEQNEFHTPIILWNHRWEFDKNPSGFFQALTVLADKALDFKVIVLGECFSQKPLEFEKAREKLGDRILQFGFVERFEEYANYLWQADILPVTSNQDFFGASVAEALYCGCYPLLPERLAYPELISPQNHPEAFYSGFDDLISRLEKLICEKVYPEPDAFRAQVTKYDWPVMISQYDRMMEEIVAKASPKISLN